MKKIAVITCYKHPDYVRATVLRRAAALIPETELCIVKNRWRGVLRYVEVVYKLVHLRLSMNPDVYVVTFRGYEILPAVLLVAIGKKVVFDEFINLFEWTVLEHKKFPEHSLRARLLIRCYGWLLRRTDKILADTEVHAAFSAKLTSIPVEKYHTIPVGTDDEVFKPKNGAQPANKDFEVFYYGNMLPLHGISYVCEAATIAARKNRQVHFTIIGGDASVEQMIAKSINRGAHITYLPFVPFTKLAEYAANSDVCLGGPFGGTVQAKMVITGKTYQFLAAGRPVVVGTISERTPFIDKANSLVVEQADAESLANAILWAASNRHKLQSIGQNGRQLYESKYSVEVISKLLQEVI